jgi:hypothetical protein
MKKSLLLAATALALSSAMASAQNYDNGKAMHAPTKAQHVARADRAPAKVLYDYVPASQPVRTNSQVYFFGVAY